MVQNIIRSREETHATSFSLSEIRDEGDESIGGNRIQRFLSGDAGISGSNSIKREKYQNGNNDNTRPPIMNN